MGESISESTDTPVSSFTLPILHTWLVEAQNALRLAREEIDALNVFPVPDGDTGTNLYLTVEAACAAFIEPCEDLAAAAVGVGRAAILGSVERRSWGPEETQGSSFRPSCATWWRS